MPPPPSGTHTGRYLPMEVGATWTYRMTDPATGLTAERTTSVEAMEDVGETHPGKQAFRMRVEHLVGASVYWQGQEGDLTVRYRAEDYDPQGVMLRTQSQMPYRLKLDETQAHVAPGAAWTDDFEQTTVNATGTTTSAEVDAWSVIAVAERVTVPAGTFDDALHVRRIGNESGTKQKDYWYVRGIGKIKESGSDKQTEELVRYLLP